MSSSKGARKRLALFARGAEAWRATSGIADRYPCPLCGVEYQAADAENGRLTLEDVPPRAVGGKPLCLTCKPCNDRGGRLVDSALADLAILRRMQESLYRKQGVFKGRVTVTVGGVETNAVMHVDRGKLSLLVDERRNAPGLFDKQIAEFRDYKPTASTPAPVINVSGRNRAGIRPVVTSILRAGYLAAFSTFGYRFAGHPSLDPVRDQIADSTSDRVPRSCAILIDREEAPSPSMAVGFLTGPIPGIAVYFPPNAVVYPHPVLVALPHPESPANFYDELHRRSYSEQGGDRINMTVSDMHDWPRAPIYSWDVPAR